MIPFERRSLDAAEVGELLGYTAKTVRERLACRADFPARCDHGGQPRWKAGEVLAWRDRQQERRKRA